MCGFRALRNVDMNANGLAMLVGSFRDNKLNQRRKKEFNNKIKVLTPYKRDDMQTIFPGSISPRRAFFGVYELNL